MLYHFLYSLHTSFSGFNVFRYITFRTIWAGLTALLICFCLGPWVIRKLSVLQVGQHIRDDVPQTHLKKAGTPTMGGILIISSVVIATLLWGDLSNHFVWIVLLVTVSFSAVGFIDDYLMQVKKRSKGLSARSKLVLQVVIALLAGVLVYVNPGFNTCVTLPFFKNISPDLGWGYIFFAALVIVGASNAVNLTDGLDGLAIGPVIVAAGTYMPGTSRSAMWPAVVKWRFFVVPWQGPGWDFCGSMPIRPRFLWGMWDHCPWVRPWERWRSSPSRRYC